MLLLFSPLHLSPIEIEAGCTHPYHPPSQPPLPLRLRINQIPQPFHLREIHPPSEKRLPRELASLGWTTVGDEGESGEDFG